MRRFGLYSSIGLLLSVVIFIQPRALLADIVVKMVVKQNVAQDDLFLRLFDGAAPNTVQNFLNYSKGATLNGGSYTNTFMHRNATTSPGATKFVLQGGSYSYDSNNGAFEYDIVNDLYTGGLERITTDPALINEFNLSNTRGTLAMAKIGERFEDGNGNQCFEAGPDCTLVDGTGPDTATSGWFVNLNDNSANLDNQNGGFTVFGEVINDGMTLIDQISNLFTWQFASIHPDFSDLPLVDYQQPDPIQEQHLVTINPADALGESPFRELFNISSDLDFGLVLVGTVNQLDLTIDIDNIDNDNLSIGRIAETDIIDTPFSILNNGCVDVTLSKTVIGANTSCTITISYAPTDVNTHSDTFDIKFPGLMENFFFTLTGRADTFIGPDIVPSSESLDFGEDHLFDPTVIGVNQIVLNITNEGNVDLNISPVTVEGDGADSFEYFDNCSGIFSPLEPGERCLLPINFKPTTLGVKNAAVVIRSDDPDQPTLTIPIVGIASIDTDGVPVPVEDAAPNNGDGNNDGIADSSQSTVTSLPAAEGGYLTIVTYDTAEMASVISVADDTLPPLPDSSNGRLDLGAIEFTIQSASFIPVTQARVGLILPAGKIPSSYYMYGPTFKNPTPHWYEFLYNGTTGAQILGNAKITSPAGEVIERSLVILHFQDGIRGDSDLALNGRIVDPGGPVFDVSSGSGGGLSIWSLICLYILYWLRNIVNQLSVRIISEA